MATLYFYKKGEKGIPLEVRDSEASAGYIVLEGARFWRLTPEETVALARGLLQAAERVWQLRDIKEAKAKGG